MKKILVLSLLLIGTSQAGTMECTVPYLSRFKYGASTEHAGHIASTAQNSSTISLKWIRKVRVIISHDDALSTALHGVWVHVCLRPGWRPTTCMPLSTQIQRNTITTDTGIVTAIPSMQISGGYSIDAVLSASSTDAMQYPIARPAFLPNRIFNVNAGVYAYDTNGKQISTQPTSRITPDVTDSIVSSITFPDMINLGTLMEGHNNAGTAIEPAYVSPPPIVFATNNIAGASLTVNGKVNQPGTQHRPPLTMGMFVESGSKPGKYSMNVVATSTCP